MHKQSLRLRREKKIVLTGGHAGSTALAVVEELKKDSQVSWEIHWIGAASAIEGAKITPFSKRMLPSQGVYSHSIIAGRLQRKFSRQSLPALIKIPVGFLYAFWLLIKIKPDITLSFGGFAAFPVVLASFILRVPVIIHEQTMAVGLANKISSPFAKKIALAREESRKYFPQRKTLLIGNPIVNSILKINPKKNLSGEPTILITGGSTGAQNINRVVDEVLETLLRDYKLIHHTGDLDFAYFEKRKRGLQPELKGKYAVHSFIANMAEAYQKVDMIIARAGANTVAEVIAIKRPTIFIPIPWTRYNEQVKNAELAEEAGIAVIINQNELIGEVLVEKIKEVRKNWVKMVAGTDSKLGELDKKAANKLVRLVGDLAK